MQTEQQGRAGAIRLIVHIGAGKTGTSSIQRTLRDNAAELQRRGVFYLGLNMEHSPDTAFPWQHPDASELFHALAPEQMTAQFTQVMAPVLELARSQGIHTLIWSNESFFERISGISAVLARAQQLGLDLQIVAYVRRHDAWIRSAYVQWGLKHKTYRGRIKSFRQWMVGRASGFSRSLKLVEKAFPNRLVLRNLDAAGDAVADFLSVCGLDPAGIATRRVNESPLPAEIFLRALYNDRFPGEVLPARFNQTLGRHVEFSGAPPAVLRRLLPTPGDLAAYNASTESDRAWLNAILQAQAQPLIDVSQPLPEAGEFPMPQLIKALAEIVVEQSLRIEKLESKLGISPDE